MPCPPPADHGQNLTRLGQLLGSRSGGPKIGVRSRSADSELRASNAEDSKPRRLYRPGLQMTTRASFGASHLRVETPKVSLDPSRQRIQVFLRAQWRDLFEGVDKSVPFNFNLVPTLE